MDKKVINVLLIEDNPGDVLLIQDMLSRVEEEQFHLEHAYRLAAGLEQLTEGAFDVLLLDLSLPDSRGLFTFDTAQAHVPQMPILVLTGLDDADVAMEAVEEGAQDYLVKSRVGGDALARAIRYAIGRKRAETALRESEARYRLLFNRGNDVIFVFNLTPEGEPGNFIEVNDMACERLEYTREELLTMSPSDIDEWDSPDELLDIMQELFVRRHIIFEVTQMTKRGHRIPTEVNAHLFELYGEPAVLAIARDITERKHAEQELRDALAEKDVLLREVHHRVKNNLQVISSLMDLQCNYIEEKQVQQIFRESQNRIRTMALIHEMLYQSAGLAWIDFGTYLQSLLVHLRRSFGSVAHGVVFNLDVQPDILVDLDTAIPCALIINELVSNVVKYAFPGDVLSDFSEHVKPQLDIHLHQEGDQLVLVVQDNGVGLPEAIDIANAHTLGLRLVTMLVRQLGASFEVECDPGTTFTFVFAAPESVELSASE